MNECLHPTFLSLQVVVQYDSTPTQLFVAQVNKVLKECKPPGFDVSVRWEEGVQDDEAGPSTQRKRKRPTSASAPKGYDGTQFPVLDGDDRCIHCLCTPCIVSMPPDFLVGSSVPHLRNNTKRFKLYKKFWGLLKDIGLWSHPEYVARKVRRTAVDDQREMIPHCIVKVSILIA